VKLRMKRPALPTDCLTSNLGEEVDLEVDADGEFRGTDEKLLNQDTIFLKEVIAVLVRAVEEKYKK